MESMSVVAAKVALHEMIAIDVGLSCIILAIQRKMASGCDTLALIRLQHIQAHLYVLST